MKSLILSFMILFIVHNPTLAFEIKGEYSSISYDTDAILEVFNNRLFLGRLRYLLRGRRALTVEDEVINKIDVISERIQEILDMHPDNLHYAMILYDTPRALEKHYPGKHNQRYEGACFYSPETDSVFLNASTSSLKIVAHEIGHVVVEKYFKVKPPVKIHELLAQFAEKHLGN